MDTCTQRDTTNERYAIAARKSIPGPLGISLGDEETGDEVDEDTKQAGSTYCWPDIFV
jgi:hypothetical protein